MASRGDIVAFFSAEQALELARITDDQLRYWDRTGFFTSPRFKENVGSFSRIYTFRDVVGLRTVGDLRRRGVPWKELRELGRWFANRYAEPWSSLSFYISGGRLYFRDPATGQLVSATKPTGQIAHGKLVDVERVAASVRRAFDSMKRRKRTEVGKVHRERYVADSQFVVAGTRIPTALIREYVEDGFTPERIAGLFPGLTVKDVNAALQHEHRKTRRAS